MSGIADSSVLETLLREGRILLLLDGLDEVLYQKRREVVKEIRRLSEQYPKNLFVVTCRTATRAVNLKRFTDVELAPFTQDQLLAFAQKWFTALTKNTSQDGQAQAVRFAQKISLPENVSFRRLAVTPLFLHLACWVFHRQGNFPTKRSEFYKQCLDLLLSQWDETKGVERDEMHQGLLLPQKLKLLSQVATITFEQGDYFFAQQTVERYIEDYLRELPKASTEPEELQSDSEAVLSAIELQHGLLAERVRGIFSFSSLTFQEYFTARKIAANYNLRASDHALKQLVRHLTEPRWREIFLLTAAMLRSADALVQLMKQDIDRIVAHDPYLQEFLTWASQKSLAVPPRSSAIRALYLALARAPHLAPQFMLACTLDQGVFLDAALEHLVLQCPTSFSPDAIVTCADALKTALTIALEPALRQMLQQLNDQLPDVKQRRDVLQAWGKTQYPAWLEQVKRAIVKHRNIQQEWYFSPEQQERLQQYYDANQLLLDCLNSNCAVTATVRQEIEAALLLPQQELEEREWERAEKQFG